MNNMKESIDYTKLAAEYGAGITKIENRIDELQSGMNKLRGAEYFLALRRLRHLKDERIEMLDTYRDIVRYLER